MANKTLAREIVPQGGTLYLPDLTTGQTVIDIESLDEHHLTALHAGQAAVMSSAVELVMDTARVNVDQDKVVEARRSAHQVGFGVFVDAWRKNKKGHPLELAVALKPFNRPEKALDEVRGYLTLAELGVETFEPVGVFPVSNGQHYVVVTKKRNDLTSLDRDKWIVGRQVVDEASAEISGHNNRTVHDISELMGYIHANGVFHPDGQIKNYAKTPEGKVGIIDTENLVKVEPGDLGVVDHAWDDIEKLVKSLIISTQDREDAQLFGVGMLYGLSLQGVRSSVEELVILPYMESLSRQLEGASDQKNVHVHELFEGVYDRFYKDEAWPNHFIEASHNIT